MRRCDQMGEFAMLVRMLLQVTDIPVSATPKPSRDKRTWAPGLLRRRGHVHDLPGTFEKITGLAIEDYIGLGFGRLSHYNTIEAGLVGHADIGINRALISPTSLRPLPRGDSLADLAPGHAHRPVDLPGVDDPSLPSSRACLMIRPSGRQSRR